MYVGFHRGRCSSFSAQHAAMVGVEVLVSKLVRPSVPPPYPFNLLQSSTLDLVIANIYVKTVYFYKPNGSSNFFSAHVLTQALSQALSHFYPIAGRITRDLNIACDGAGALFVEALANCTVEELGELKPDLKLLKLVPTLDTSQDISSWPLLIIQITTFECGGVALGVGIEHHVADGVSALNFLNTWSDIARGKAYTGLPCFDRAHLKARTPPTPQFVHDEYQRLPQKNMEKLKRSTKAMKRTVSNGVQKCLVNGGLGLGLVEEPTNNEVHGSVVNSLGLGFGLGVNGVSEPESGGEEIDGELSSVVNGGSHKEEARNGRMPETMVKKSISERPANGVPKIRVSFEEPAGSSDEEAVVSMFKLQRGFLRKLKEKHCNVAASTYELLAAHVWRCCCEARNLPNEEESMLLIAVDGRTRLRNPPLPENYVGNAVFNCCPVLSVGEVRASVEATAGEIHGALKGMDDAYCRSALDFLELQPDLSRFVKGAHTFASPNLGFISWAKFPMYDCDFGWGRPVHVGVAHIAWEGHAYVLPPPPPSDGSLRLCISLQRRHMQRFSEILPVLHS